MNVAAIVCSLVLAAAMTLSGVLKFLRPAHIRAFADAVHLSVPQLQALGTVQLAGVLGILAGIVYRPFVIAAVVGFVLYFLGAIGAHIRARDVHAGGAVCFLLLSSATLALTIASA